MAEFYVWIAVITPAYEPIITEGLLQMGYTVGPGLGGDRIVVDNTIIYRLGRDKKSVDLVEKDLISILQSNKMLYHLVVVTLLVPNFQGRSRASNISYLNGEASAKADEEDIDDAMQKINKIFASYGQDKMTPEEVKRFELKKKNS